MKDSENNISRRSFLQRTAASVVGAGLGISAVTGKIAASGGGEIKL